MRFRCLVEPSSAFSTLFPSRFYFPKQIRFSLLPTFSLTRKIITLDRHQRCLQSFRHRDIHFNFVPSTWPTRFKVGHDMPWNCLNRSFRTEFKLDKFGQCIQNEEIRSRIMATGRTCKWIKALVNDFNNQMIFSSNEMCSILLTNISCKY